MKKSYRLFIEAYGYRNIVLLMYFFTLMYPMNVTSSILILYCVTCLLEYKAVFKNSFAWKAYLFSILPAIIIFVGFFFFDSKYYVLKELEKNLTFFILSFFCIADFKNIQKLIPAILTSLFIGLVSLEIASIFLAIYKKGLGIFFNYATLNFDNEYLSDYVLTHHVYFSLLLSIAIILVIQNHHKILIKKKILNLLIVFSFVYNILLFARTTLFFFLLILVISLIVKNQSKKIIIAAGGVILVSLLVNKKSYTINRLSVFSGDEAIERRLELNKVSISIFEESPIFGVGPGRIRYERLDRYKAINYQSAYKYLYNSHNQYLDYLSVNGLIGLLIFLGIIFYTCFVSLKRKQGIIYAFLLFYFSCMTETFLVRNKGIVIFNLIIILFLIVNIDLFMKNEKKEYIINK